MEIKTKYNIGEIVWFQYFGQEIYGEITSICFHASKENKRYTQYSIDDLYILEENDLYSDINELLDSI